MWRVLRASSPFRLGWVIFAATLAPAVSLGVARPALGAIPFAGDNRLWDDAHRLSASQSSALKGRLVATARRVGSPVFVFVADGLRRDTARALAARTFAARELGAAGDASNPVLLLVSPRDRAAAIETGKGNAGIVPEIDAVRIIKQLEASLHNDQLGKSLTEALDAIAASAEATAARRRPSTVDEDLPPPDPVAAGGRRGGPPTEEELGDGELATGQPGAPTPGSTAPAPKKKRSRLPIAVGIAALVLLGLALRRRRNVTAAKKTLPPAPRPPRSRER